MVYDVLWWCVRLSPAWGIGLSIIYVWWLWWYLWKCVWFSGAWGESRPQRWSGCSWPLSGTPDCPSPRQSWPSVPPATPPVQCVCVCVCVCVLASMKVWCKSWLTKPIATRIEKMRDTAYDRPTCNPCRKTHTHSIEHLHHAYIAIEPTSFLVPKFLACGASMKQTIHAWDSVGRKTGFKHVIHNYWGNLLQHSSSVFT